MLHCLLMLDVNRKFTLVSCVCLLGCAHVGGFRNRCNVLVRWLCANEPVTIRQVVEAAAVPSAGEGVVPPTLVSVSSLVHISHAMSTQL